MTVSDGYTDDKQYGVSAFFHDMTSYLLASFTSLLAVTVFL